MAFSTINLETFKSLTGGSEENECVANIEENQSFTEKSEVSEENRNDVDLSKTKKIEYKVREILPIPDELWGRSAVSSRFRGQQFH